MSPDKSPSSPVSAERRDHRRLGRKLDYFSIHDDVGPGLVLWHPKGGLIRKLLEDYWRDEHLKRGYQLVYSPHIGRAGLWERSGHLSYFRDSMFEPMELDGEAYFVKPMNCPFHMKIFQSRRRSYRELPLRYAEIGAVYRYERSGSLHGLLRLRGFSQDDSHILCSEDQVDREIRDVVELAVRLLDAFGFRPEDRRIHLAGRPEKGVGSDEMWHKAGDALRRACEALGISYELDVDGGAFYGPKIDIKVKDALGRFWQCSTIQFDFNLPARFDLAYIDAENQLRRPYVIHRALFGALERFFAVLLEYHAGALPVWLAPVQVHLLPHLPEPPAVGRRGWPCSPLSGCSGRGLRWGPQARAQGARRVGRARAIRCGGGRRGGSRRQSGCPLARAPPS